MFCETAGAPMLVRPTAEYRGSHRAQGADAHREQHRGPYFDAAAVDFDAELVLASMLPQGAEEPTETLGGTARPERPGGESVAGPTMPGDPRDSAAASGRSELTERAAKLGHGHVRSGAARSAATSACRTRRTVAGGASSGRGGGDGVNRSGTHRSRGRQARPRTTRATTGSGSSGGTSLWRRRRRRNDADTDGGWRYFRERDGREDV